MHQLHLQLRETNPAIWRRIQVPADFPLEDLHVVIQIVFGNWDGRHHWQIRSGSRLFAPSIPFLTRVFTPGLKDALKSTVQNVFKKEGDTATYQYGNEEYGQWEIDLRLEAIVEGRNFPTCIDGANGSPPDDCGGPVGFREFKAAVVNPNDPKFFRAKGEVDKNWAVDRFDLEGTVQLIEGSFEEYGKG